MSIDRIGSSGSQAVQRFYVQRAVQPKTAAPQQKAAAAPALYEFEPLQVPSQQSLSEKNNLEPIAVTTSRSQAEQNGPPLDEIQSIAKKAGFVGLSERDIKRAYVLGESLLADYRV